MCLNLKKLRDKILKTMDFLNLFESLHLNKYENIMEFTFLDI